MMSFKTNFDDLDERSIFANRVLALLYQNYDGNLSAVVHKAKQFIEDFETHIHNVYELVEDEIPLHHYYNLLEYGADNWGYTDEEYNKEIKKTIEACELYYNKERWFI